MLKSETQKFLQDKGIASVELSFSGGHDEGWIESMIFLDAEANEVELNIERVYAGMQYGGGNMQPKKVAYIDGKSMPWDEVEPSLKASSEIVEELEKPIFDRYGTFAGEFSVYGRLNWDVATGEGKLSGDETVEHYEPFEERI